MRARKRLLLLIPLILLGLAGLYGLITWALREARLRPLSGPLSVSDPALVGDISTFRAGNFDIALYTIGADQPSGGDSSHAPGPRLVITSRADPANRWLWHTLKGQAFVAAAVGRETVDEARGSYFISDKLSRTCTKQTIDTIRTGQTAVTVGYESIRANKSSDGATASKAIASSGGNTTPGATTKRGDLSAGDPAQTAPPADTVTIAGQLGCSDGGSIGYTLSFSPAGDNQLAFHLAFSDPAFNRAYLSYASDADEHFFGFGEQFSRFDHKGQRVPIWVSEQGIGRGQQPITALVDLAARSGGNDYTTYAAVPHYITSRLRSLFLENSEYAVFDLRQPERVQVSAFAARLDGRILYGATPTDLIREYTAWAGRMRPLPDWILSGAVVGMQGGTEKVRQVYQQLQTRGAPVAAFWLQDWVGQRTTSFGKQLWWNWELDPERYPDWPTLTASLAADDVRVLLYASPFLADVSALKPTLRRNLFKEARDAGYLVRRTDGSPYLIQNTDFSAGLIDLTLPAAVTWYQSVLKEQLVDIGASGWMADFGEALPYDAVLADGRSGADDHNLYPQQWAALNRGLLDSLPNGDQMVFFNRAAFSRSPAYATLMWEGDQLVTWDAHDGIKSAVTGLLSGGMSGFSLNHSDIGGYTGINNPLARTTRSKELLLRWMELSALTTIYRTHEGNLPDLNAQFYTDDESLDQFTRMAKLYSAWAPERKRLVAEAAESGLPVARPLFIHYPDDPQVYSLSYQEYLLGPDLLVAPVLDPGADSVRAYLPAGAWVHVWSGKVYRSPYQGQWVTVPAPLGQPGLFYKELSEPGQDLMEALQAAGLVPRQLP